MNTVMIRVKKFLRRTAPMVAVLVFGLVLVTNLKTNGQDKADAVNRVATEQWEYLALAGPTTTSLFQPMRKEPSAAFTREALGFEQQLDKVGANGWELVAVAGPPTDPAYYFKRRK
jgi:methylthioribose-1-phosphate isomerase